MTDTRHTTGDAIRSESERAARREWQRRSRACGHAWTFNADASLRCCRICGRWQSWCFNLRAWVSRTQKQRQEKLATARARARYALNQERPCAKIRR